MAMVMPKFVPVLDFRFSYFRQCLEPIRNLCVGENPFGAMWLILSRDEEGLVLSHWPNFREDA